jgi:hypothetical protein
MWSFTTNLKREKKSFLFPLVAKHHMSSQIRWRRLTYRQMGYCAMSQRASKFLTEHVTKKGLHVIWALNTVIDFLQFKAKE